MGTGQRFSLSSLGGVYPFCLLLSVSFPEDADFFVYFAKGVNAVTQAISYCAGRDLLLEVTRPLDTEAIPLKDCADRILGRDLVAGENVPPFDRSPYDGYAFCAADSADASPEHPVTLRILEEIPAGGVPHFSVTKGCAVKILTGAPIPPGADAVTMLERTKFTPDSVTLLAPSRPGSNIVRAGEDVRKGQLLAKAGTPIDPGLMGVLAAQNVPRPTVYRVPRIGILSTGDELLEVGDAPRDGGIYNANQYMLISLLTRLGCRPILLGTAPDRTEDICQGILEGLARCDGLILTGGVSAGDYDLTPAAMELAGARLLFRGVDLKPGMACAYGIRDGKLICGLSGNPASSMTNFCAVAAPALKKLCGRRDFLPSLFPVRLAEGFAKSSRATRLLRGRLDISGGEVRLCPSGAQGNVVLSSTIGCNAMAIVPPGSGPVPAGTVLQAFLI